MRLPLPERFKMKGALIFIILLVLAQQIEKTSITFSLLSALYVGLFTIGFNLGGGIYYVAGGFIFFNGVLTCIVGLLYKVVIGEPGQSNLLVPNQTMEAYCLGMAGMVLAAALSRRLILRQAVLANIIRGESMKQAALGCLVVGIGLQVGTGGSGNAASFASAVSQLNHFVQMAIILGTTYEIQHSGGKRSTNWIVWVAGLWIFMLGIVSFSKEGMFTSVATWIIPAVVLRFDFSRKQVAGLAVMFFLMIHYLVPLSQYGRQFRKDTGLSYAIAFDLFAHPEGTRKLYLEQESTQDDEGAPHYYNTPQGIFDREQMLAYDDALVNITDQGSVRGYEPTINALYGIIPHFLWKDKPTEFTGNEYGREIGVLGEDDITTGISFSPTGDAYHQGGFVGVLFLIPLTTFMLFVIGGSLAGDTRKAPWGLLLIALSSHLGPEGLVGGVIYLATYGALAVWVIALLSKFALPVFANLLTGSERTRVRRTLEFRPTVRGSRINPLLRQPDADPPNS